MKILEALHRCGVASRLNDAEQRQLLELAREVAFPAGDSIIREGAVETAFYVLLTGTVEVLKGEDRIATMEAGSVFGEMALFNDSVRTSSVRSLGEVKTVRFETPRLVEDARAGEPYAMKLLDALGRVTVERLQALVYRSARDPTVVRQLFEAIDLDESGRVSTDDLVRLLQAWGEPLSRDDVTLLMSEVDPEGRRSVDYSGFRRFVLGLTSFNKIARPDAFRTAYEDSTRAAHLALDLPFVGAGDRRSSRRVLRVDTINPCVQKMSYEVRGELVLNAQRIEQELRLGGRRDYENVLWFNIGNPQAVGCRPVTFYREVLALCDHPPLLDRPGVESIFSAEAIDRARTLLRQIPGGTGAYSHSQGAIGIRERVAAFLEERDGYPAYPHDIFLTNGASTGISLMLQILLAQPNDALLLPVPQYPLYSALVEMLDARAVGYHLNEEEGWSLDLEELERSVSAARARGLDPVGMVVINPGNPTGRILGQEALVEVVRFCRRHGLVLFADEVYMLNVYDPTTPFVSLKKVVRSLGPEFDDFELVSFHSTSKGFIGECGRRGGYMEVCGIDPEVHAQLFKLASLGLCSNLSGQIMVELMVHPPDPGGRAAELLEREKGEILSGLRRRSRYLVDALDALEGIECQPVDGAMYVFPRLHLPERAVREARAAGRSPDMHYCLSLLERAGICTVPGSGFGQRPDTYHLRMTFLPQDAQLEEAMVRFGAHHRAYMEEYG